MHIFYSRENIKTCIFTAVKIQDLIFTTFFLFSQYGLREATLYGISVSFLRETTIGVSARVALKLNKRKSFYKFVCYN